MTTRLEQALQAVNNFTSSQNESGRMFETELVDRARDNYNTMVEGGAREATAVGLHFLGGKVTKFITDKAEELVGDKLQAVMKNATDTINDAVDRVQSTATDAFETAEQTAQNALGRALSRFRGEPVEDEDEGTELGEMSRRPREGGEEGEEEEGTELQDMTGRPVEEEQEEQEEETTEPIEEADETPLQTDEATTEATDETADVGQEALADSTMQVFDEADTLTDALGAL